MPMLNPRLSLMTVILLTLPLTRVAVATGGNSSGGGTVVEAAGGGQPVLLDFFIADSNFKDSKPNSKNALRPGLGTKGRRTAKVEIQKNPAFRILQAKLDAWQRSSPVVVALLRKALDFTDFRYATGHPESNASDARRYLPPGFESAHPKTKLKTAVFYDNGQAFIVPKIWNRAGERTQAGLLLHEAARQIQIAYGDDMPDKTLQELTAKIMLGDPSKEDSLDRMPGLGKFFRTVDAGSKERFAQSRRSLCGKMSALFTRAGTKAKTVDKLRNQFCAEPDSTPDSAEVSAWAKGLYDFLDGNHDALELETGSEGAPGLRDLRSAAQDFFWAVTAAKLAEQTPEMHHLRNRMHDDLIKLESLKQGH